MAIHKPNVDIMGYLRGAHKDGELICDGFVFNRPGGRKTASGDPIYGWNDTAAVSCAKCGERDDDHVLLGDVNDEIERAEQERRERMAKSTTSAAVPVPLKPSATTPAHKEVWLLDDAHDPLCAVSAAKRALPASTSNSIAASGADSPSISAEDFKAEVERMVQESLRKPQPTVAEATPAATDLAAKLAAMEAKLAAATAKLEQAGLN